MKKITVLLVILGCFLVAGSASAALWYNNRLTPAQQHPFTIKGHDGNVIALAPTPTPTFTPVTAPTSAPTGPNTCNNLLVLIDKSHAMSSSYTPPDLVYLKSYGIPVTSSSLQGRGIMMGELQQLFTDSKAAGVNLVAASVYRSYWTQNTVFNNYVREYGEAKANTFSARPGQSQHQLGTAVDFTSNEVQYQLTQTFGQTNAGKWLSANAYKYGFFISYPNGYDNVTGYEYEPWHFRYLGVQTATALQQSGQIMQTYLVGQGIMPHC